MAFPPVPLSAGGAFYMYDDAQLCERALEGKSWDEVDPRLIGSRSDALAFLDRERFVAWLPMYLRLLGHLDPMYSFVPEVLVGKLTRPDPETSSKRQQREFEELVGRLSAAQRRAVGHALQLFIAEAPGYSETARCAFDRYWAAFV